MIFYAVLAKNSSNAMTVTTDQIAETIALISRAETPFVAASGENSLRQYLRDRHIVPDEAMWNAIMDAAVRHRNLDARAAALAVISGACKHDRTPIPADRLKKFMHDYLDHVPFSDQQRCYYFTRIFEYAVKTSSDHWDADLIEKSAKLPGKIEHPISMKNTGMHDAISPLFGAWAHLAAHHPDLYMKIRPHREFETMLAINDVNEVFGVSVLLLGMVDALKNLYNIAEMRILSPSARAIMAQIIPAYDECNEKMRAGQMAAWRNSADFEMAENPNGSAIAINPKVVQFISQRVK